MSIRIPMRTPFGPVRPGGFHFPHGSRSGVSARFSRKPRRSDVSSFDTSPARQFQQVGDLTGLAAPPVPLEDQFTLDRVRHFNSFTGMFHIRSNSRTSSSVNLIPEAHGLPG